MSALHNKHDHARVWLLSYEQGVRRRGFNCGRKIIRFLISQRWGRVKGKRKNIHDYLPNAGEAYPAEVP